MLGIYELEEYRRVRVAAAEMRLQAIHCQLSVCFTFCSMAETEVNLGQAVVARELILKVRHAAQTVQRHLDEPAHVPANRLEEARDRLAQLESLVCSIEAQLKN
jgi:hypothetical protein